MPLNPLIITRVFSFAILLLTAGTITLFFLYEDYYGQKLVNKYNLQYVVRMIAMCANIVNMGLAMRKPQKDQNRRLHSCGLRMLVTAMVACMILLDPIMSIVLDAAELLAEHARGTFITTMIGTLVYIIVYSYSYIVWSGKYYAMAPKKAEEVPLQVL
ncbi:hypothetical protein LPJ66_007265 [Kickxella alabastrina]|uniref:Uncharacterized protein n=1 Tax=Kickxella alabastrina TaxID=61397 RepID=A0ACC1I9X4_9FUNG|nr:hypothetical protein LPJ66_007265 [Kickxella alabastrina]